MLASVTAYWVSSNSVPTRCLTVLVCAKTDPAVMLPAAHVLANMTAYRSAGGPPARHPGSFLAQKLQQLQARGTDAISAGVAWGWGRCSQVIELC